MTTPNIEWLIGHLRSFSGTSLAPALMHQAADTLQSQAERIKELESEVEMWKATANAVVDFEKATLRQERDTLRAQLDAIAATEPTYYFGGGRLYGDKTSALFDNATPAITELFTRPMPADVKDVERYRWLRNAGMDERNRLEHYAGPELDAAIDAALSKYKGAK